MTTSPALELSELSCNSARTWAMPLSLPKPALPIRLRATEMPIEAPTPLPELAAIDTDRAATVAEMRPSLSAYRPMSWAPVTWVLPSKASVLPMRVLTATAPAPLKARAEPPPEAAIEAEAATDRALMLLRVNLSPSFMRSMVKLRPSASTSFQVLPASSTDSVSFGSSLSQLMASL